MTDSKQRLPVVDGDSGADIYGYATTARGALRVARGCFVDPVVEAYLDGPIAMADGTTLPTAWIVLTKDCAARIVAVATTPPFAATTPL